jgi:hypothetical protein
VGFKELDGQKRNILQAKHGPGVAAQRGQPLPVGRAVLGLVAEQRQRQRLESSGRNGGKGWQVGFAETHSEAAGLAN